MNNTTIKPIVGFAIVYDVIRNQYKKCRTYNISNKHENTEPTIMEIKEVLNYCTKEIMQENLEMHMQYLLKEEIKFPN
ncbi:TPA: hypothetical protein ACG3P3_000589 [Clostridioides difficile]|nr:hypothetical protein [Clostridioides difficile]